MKQKKKERRKENQRGSAITLMVFLMIVILIGAAWFFLQEFQETQKEFFDNNDEAFHGLSAANYEQLSRMFPEEIIIENEDKLRGLFPASFSVYSSGEDINSDGNPEHVLIEYHEADAEHAEALQEYGFDRIITRLEILSEQPGGDLVHLLRIRPDQMTDHHDEQLVGQIHAEHGYAFSMVPFDEEPYTSSVKLINLVILDENFRPASDELVIYWKPSENRYAATNAFGAPGTF